VQAVRAVKLDKAVRAALVAEARAVLAVRELRAVTAVDGAERVVRAAEVVNPAAPALAGRVVAGRPRRTRLFRADISIITPQGSQA